MNRTLTRLLPHARPVTPERIAVETNGLPEQSSQFLPRGDIQIVRRLDGSLPAVYVDLSLLTRPFSTSP